jgi:hypothetical protein
MNSPVVGLRVASVIFGLVCLAQLLRIIVRLEIIVGGHIIARRFSAIAVIVAGALCLWLWMLSTKADKPKPDATPVKP